MECEWTGMGANSAPPICFANRLRSAPGGAERPRGGGPWREKEDK